MKDEADESNETRRLGTETVHDLCLSVESHSEPNDVHGDLGHASSLCTSDVNPSSDEICKHFLPFGRLPFHVGSFLC